MERSKEWTEDRLVAKRESRGLKKTGSRVNKMKEEGRDA